MSGITLYTWSTPNGYKITIFLELLGVKYTVKPVDVTANAQKEEWFVKLNPNGRVPTLTDEDTGVTISETGAILQYLADTYDKEHKFSYPQGTTEYLKVLEVLTFQVASVAPTQGQALHFGLFSPEKIPYAIDQYTRRDQAGILYGGRVLEPVFW